ncbi:MAG TPA: hypothetical protein VGJ20_30825 [Xanthobacteraceae bacterium]|jgi:hypothetical protein
MITTHRQRRYDGPTILKNEQGRLAFQFDRARDLVDQLQEQLRSEGAQHRFNMAEKDRELARLARELAEARLEPALRPERSLHPCPKPQHRDALMAELKVETPRTVCIVAQKYEIQKSSCRRFSYRYLKFYDFGAYGDLSTCRKRRRPRLDLDLISHRAGV